MCAFVSWLHCQQPRLGVTTLRSKPSGACVRCAPTAVLAFLVRLTESLSTSLWHGLSTWLRKGFRHALLGFFAGWRVDPRCHRRARRAQRCTSTTHTVACSSARLRIPARLLCSVALVQCCVMLCRLRVRPRCTQHVPAAIRATCSVIDWKELVAVAWFQLPLRQRSEARSASDPHCDGQVGHSAIARTRSALQSSSWVRGGRFVRRGRVFLSPLQEFTMACTL